MKAEIKLLERPDMPDFFIDKIKKIVLNNIENDNFGVSDLAAGLGLSRSQTLRKIKSLTGKSANEYLREIRLQEAVKLIQNSDLTASEIAYKVGFGSPSYFNKCFLDEFGVTPGEYKKRLAEGDLKELVSETKPKILKIRKKILTGVIFIASLFAVYLLTDFPGNKSSIQQASIAILPFSDFSENNDQEHLADGITEILTRDLSKLKELRVPSRTSSMKFKGEKKLSTEIAKELNVRLILEGSVLLKGDSILITVQLISAIPEEKHLWADSYSTSYADVYGIMNQVSNEIVSNISSVLKTGAAKEKIIRVDPEANELYMRGKHLFNTQKTRYVSLLKAVEYLEKAIEKDPDFAPPYVTLAETFLAINFLISDNEEKFMNRDKARRSIEKALDLDDSFAEAFISKGNLVGKFDWDWNKMKEMAETGLKLEPSNANAHIILSNYYVIKGNYKKALAEALKAEELDPLNSWVGCLVGERYYIAEEFEKSIEKYNRVIELDPGYGLAYNGIGFTYIKSGNINKAVESWQKLQQIMGNQALYQCYNDSSFIDCLHFFLSNAKKGIKPYCSNPSIVASVSTIAGEELEAMEYLEIAYNTKNEDLPVMLSYPDFYSLHNNPRFKELVKKVGTVIPDR